jgi:hypothetical protein
MSSSKRQTNEWRGGDTYLHRRDETDKHLWIVLSEPSLNAAKVVVANLTSLEPYKEQLCIVEPGEHVYVTKRSCVYYRFAHCLRLEYLEEREVRKEIERLAPLSPALLARVRNGASQSLHMPTEVWDVIESQDLIDPF